jgi:hypothetical protein
MNSKIPDLVSLAMTSSQTQLEKAILVLQGKDTSHVVPVEPLLTAVEVAKQLNISRVTAHRWKLPSHTLGGKPRMRMSEVLKYLESEEFKLHAAALRRERAKKRKGSK